MSTTNDRPSIAEPRMQAGTVTPRMETWMAGAIAPHRFGPAAASMSAAPSAPMVDTLPVAHANVPAWPAFRAASRPRSARYLSFADREHLLRYARARADIPS